MFKYPATEIYDAAGKTRVVWSIEEYEAAIADGYSAEKPEAAPEPALPEPVAEAEPPAKKRTRKPEVEG